MKEKKLILMLLLIFIFSISSYGGLLEFSQVNIKTESISGESAE